MYKNILLASDWFRNSAVRNEQKADIEATKI